MTEMAQGARLKTLAEDNRWRADQRKTKKGRQGEMQTWRSRKQMRGRRSKSSLF